MNLKEVLEKAQKQVLDDEVIKKELLKYVDDENLYPALLELEKRGVKEIICDINTIYTIRIRCYSSIKSTEIMFLQKNQSNTKSQYIGGIEYDYKDNKFVVSPSKDDYFKNIEKEHLIKMRNVLKMSSENFIINLVANKLRSLL